jgi:hypothetical protein
MKRLFNRITHNPIIDAFFTIIASWFVILLARALIYLACAVSGWYLLGVVLYYTVSEHARRSIQWFYLLMQTTYLCSPVALTLILIAIVVLVKSRIAFTNKQCCHVVLVLGAVVSGFFALLLSYAWLMFSHMAGLGG